jgi:hypothetical protein
MNAQAPVGTTLALLERSMKVMSGVQARLHAAMKKELRLLAKIVHDYMPVEYAYEMDGNFNRIEDFDKRVDVIPVSDPNAATMSQRIMQYQAALQLAQQAPQLYDMGMLHRQMLEVLGIQDASDIIKLPDEIKPADPVTENMMIMKQEPVKVFTYQDHEAHIAVHMAAAQDPKIMQMIGQSPFAQVIQQNMAAHITEHVAAQYRKEIEKQLGVEMPPQDQPLPEDLEVQISRLTQEAAAKLLKKDQAEAQQQQIQQQQQDPVVQMQQAEMQLKQAELKHKMQMDAAKLQLEAKKIEAQNQREGAKLGVELATELDKNQRADQREGAKLGIEVARELTRGGRQ